MATYDIAHETNQINGLDAALAACQPLDADLTRIAGLTGARGDVLYYGASGWTNLGAGTAGKVLISGGAGADPSWGSSFTTSYKTSDQSINNTTLTDDGMPNFEVVAGGIYRFRWYLFITIGGASEGIKITVDGPTATNFIAEIVITDDVTKTLGAGGQGRITTLGSSVGTSALSVGSAFATVDGTIEMSNGGKLVLRWAQNAHVGTSTTVLRGSHGICQMMS